MSSVDGLLDLGYGLQEAMPADDQRPAVYFVIGPGVTLYVAENDYETLRSLLDSHDERVLEQSETPEQTRARLAGATT